jgi:hypothetical protein
MVVSLVGPVGHQSAASTSSRHVLFFFGRVSPWTGRRGASSSRCGPTFAPTRLIGARHRRESAASDDRTTPGSVLKASCWTLLRTVVLSHENVVALLRRLRATGHPDGAHPHAPEGPEGADRGRQAEEAPEIAESCVRRAAPQKCRLERKGCATVTAPRPAPSVSSARLAAASSCPKSSRASSRSRAGAPLDSMAVDRRRFSTSLVLESWSPLLGRGDGSCRRW